MSDEIYYLHCLSEDRIVGAAFDPVSAVQAVIDHLRVNTFALLGGRVDHLVLLEHPAWAEGLDLADLADNGDLEGRAAMVERVMSSIGGILLLQTAMKSRAETGVD